jgi:hypothetical protein
MAIALFEMLAFDPLVIIVFPSNELALNLALMSKLGPNLRILGI